MYKKIKEHQAWGKANCIERLLDHAIIPFDPANTDYQQYLKWLAEGNTPQEADDAIN